MAEFRLLEVVLLGEKKERTRSELFRSNDRLEVRLFADVNENICELFKKH